MIRFIVIYLFCLMFQFTTAKTELFILLFLQRHELLQSIKISHFFIFSIRSWNQDKDKFWIYFLLSITKRIGHFSIPNMRSKYLPSFRWALHKQTDNETWLVINNPSWLIIVNRSTTTKLVKSTQNGTIDLQPVAVCYFLRFRSYISANASDISRFEYFSPKSKLHKN